MSKTETTLAMELILTNQFRTKTNYAILHKEVSYGNEICDLMGFDRYGELTCIELKQSVADFHSKCAVTFVGDRNYYAMPYDIYEKVKDEIPEDIGVYTLPRERILAKDTDMFLIKNCKHKTYRYDRLYTYAKLQNSLIANCEQFSEAFKLRLMNVLDRCCEDRDFYKWYMKSHKVSYFDKSYILSNKKWEIKDE